MFDINTVVRVYRCTLRVQAARKINKGGQYISRCLFKQFENRFRGIDKLFQVLVQISQVVLSPLIVVDELLLALEELLAALL